MKKITAIILCRYSSSRLPGKILKKIDGIPILQHIYNQLSLVFDSDSILVATSCESSDDILESFCIDHQINVFRGDLNNVSLRFLEASLSMNSDYSYRINGDNLFINTELISQMNKVIQSNQPDFLSNVQGRTYGFGMSIECVRTSFYQKHFDSFKSDYYHEHVTAYFYDNPEIGQFEVFKNLTYRNVMGKKFAIDTQEDFHYMEKLYFEVKESSKNGTFTLQTLNQVL